MWIGMWVMLRNWLDEENAWDRTLKYYDDTMAFAMSGNMGGATTEILAATLRLALDNAGKKHYIYCKDSRALDGMFNKMRAMLPDVSGNPAWRSTDWKSNGPHSITLTNDSIIEFRWG